MKNSTNETNNDSPKDEQHKPKLELEIKMMGVITNFNFYIPDATGDINGMAFRMAYKAALNSKNNKDLCACIASMLCSVVPGFKTNIETALHEICIKPHFISLPSQADENKIVDSELPPLDWPSILVMFGYCILLLFELKYSLSVGYDIHIVSCIRSLKTAAKCDPNSKLGIPFDRTKADSVNAMLFSRQLQETVKKSLISNKNHSNSQVSSLFKYLITILP
ncbi:hypothetical protein RYX36_002128 [Vicia faba]